MWRPFKYYLHLIFIYSGYSGGCKPAFNCSGLRNFWMSLFPFPASFYLNIFRVDRELIVHSMIHNDTLTLGRTSLDEWSASHRGNNTRIQTCNPSKRVPTSLHLKRRSHWFRHRWMHAVVFNCLIVYLLFFDVPFLTFQGLLGFGFI
jgi:hypothetical protein